MNNAYVYKSKIAALIKKRESLYPAITTALTMAVFSRARIGCVAPLLSVRFICALTGGESLPALLTGALLGSLLFGYDSSLIFIPAQLAICIAMWLIWDKKKRGGRRYFCALASGISVIVPAIVAVGDKPAMWLIAVVMAMSVSLISACMCGAWGLSGLAKSVLYAFASVLCVKSFGLSPAPMASLFAVMYASAGRGALAGAILGIPCGIQTIGLLCVIGASADFVQALYPGAYQRSIAAILAFFAMKISLFPDISWFMPVFCALQAILPARFVSMMTDSLAIKAKRDERVTGAVMKKTGRKLAALGDSFLKLSESCGLRDPEFGERMLMTKMRGALCGGCRSYEECWAGSDGKAVKLFCQIMTMSVENSGSPFDDNEVSPEILRLCRRGNALPARLSNILNDFAAQRHRRLRLMDARQLVASQFSQAAEIINSMAIEQNKPLTVRDGMASRIKEAVEKSGVELFNAIMIDNEITLDACSPWMDRTLSSAENAILRLTSVPYVRETVSGKTAVFTRVSALCAECAVSSLAGEEGVVSGDSYLTMPIASDRFFAALSDGMGSGDMANEESSRVIELMKTLALAGIPRDTAVAAVNGVMIARGGEEIFATVDMLIIDLAASRAEFTKLSACRSYIARETGVMAIDGGRLPLGILERVSPGITSVKVRSDDMILMITDGVSEVLSNAAIENVMREMRCRSPKEAADTILNTAASRSPARRDDMTAICVKLRSAASDLP